MLYEILFILSGLIHWHWPSSTYHAGHNSYLSTRIVWVENLQLERCTPKKTIIKLISTKAIDNKPGNYEEPPRLITTLRTPPIFRRNDRGMPDPYSPNLAVLH